jgi:hypothetical protein
MIEKMILLKIRSIGVRSVTRPDIETVHHELKETPYRASPVLGLRKLRRPASKLNITESGVFFEPTCNAARVDM